MQIHAIEYFSKQERERERDFNSRELAFMPIFVNLLVMGRWWYTNIGSSDHIDSTHVF